MQVTAKGRYALRAIIQISLNAKNGPISVKQISKDEDISPIFLEQIFTMLKKHGLIESVRGPGGGFLMKKDPREITVNDILRAVNEGIGLSPCCASDSVSSAECPRLQECKVSQFWVDANTAITKLFSSYSLDRVIKEYGYLP